MNHFLSELDDFYWLAHVQYKNVPPPSHRTCLYNELGRFRNGHEISGDLGVGHCQRATGLDLLVKQWDYGT
ncbi:hypothetical protein D3C77_610270 [compost metagenome]